MFTFCKIHESSIGVKVVEGDKKMEDSPFYNHDVVEISYTGTQYVVLQTENTREAVHVKNDYFSQLWRLCYCNPCSRKPPNINYYHTSSTLSLPRDSSLTSKIRSGFRQSKICKCHEGAYGS